MQYAFLGERALHLEYAGLNLALGRVQMMMGSVNASPVRTHGVVQSFPPVLVSPCPAICQYRHATDVQCVVVR